MKIQAQDYHKYDEKRVLNEKSVGSWNQKCKNDEILRRFRGVLEIRTCFPCIRVSVAFKLRDLGKMIYLGIVRMDGSKE
jgi:hypothetical protein